MKKLYRFKALVEFAVIVAADTEKKAVENVSKWGTAWVDTGEYIGVNEWRLVDVRVPDSQKDLKYKANIIV